MPGHPTCIQKEILAHCGVRIRKAAKRRAPNAMGRHPPPASVGIAERIHLAACRACSELADGHVCTVYRRCRSAGHDGRPCRTGRKGHNGRQISARRQKALRHQTRATRPSREKAIRTTGELRAQAPIPRSWHSCIRKRATLCSPPDGRGKLPPLRIAPGISDIVDLPASPRRQAPNRLVDPGRRFRADGEHPSAARVYRGRRQRSCDIHEV